MKVKLVQSTQNPIDVMWTAARTCYSEKSPVEIWDDWCLQVGELKLGVEKLSDAWEQEKEITNKHWNLVKKVLDSGHQSVAEHVYFTFAIEGISRACSHQLVRHRAGIVFSQQSQRYVEIKEDISLLEGKNFPKETYKENTEIIEMLDKYFVWDHDNYIEFYALTQALYCYLYQVREGIAPEDARNILPNCTKTNITMSVNLRELIHMCNLRLCTRAQKEIRDLFGLIKREIKNEDERLASYLVPTCEVNGFCKEHKCCGRKPRLEDVIEGYYKYKGLKQ